MAVVKVSRNIPQSAFKEQKTITSVYFGSKCSSVGQDAFSGCISLSEINYNNEIIEIGGGAFAETALSTVNLSKLNKIKSSEEQNGYGAFQDCSILTNINIQQCSSIGNNAFYNCSSLSDINLKACILIGSNAFYNCGQLSKANLENCKYIYKDAFLNCSSLKEITLSNSKNIDDRVFYNCNHLSIVYVNTQDVIPLGSSVFYSGASIIKNIKFYMQPGAISKFTNDKNWKEYEKHMIETPNSNQIIYTTYSGNPIDEKHTLENGFIKITFGEDVVQLSSKIFKDNKDLTSIYLPYELETIGEQEFEGCINLDKFMPPQANTLTTIGDYAFKNCTSLKSFEIPESVTSIGEGVFAGCSNIEKFEGKYVKYNNKAIVYDDTLISVAQKDNSETGGRYYKISNIDSNIKSLGKYCFYGFKELIRVDIPSNIDRIGENAFDGCDNLQEVHFDGDPSNIDFEKNAFGIFVDENENEIKNGREDFKIFIPEIIFKNINFDASIKKYEKYIYPEPAEKQIIIYYLNNSNDSDSDYDIYYDSDYDIYYDSDYDSDSNNKNYKTVKFHNNLSFEGNKEISKVIFGEKITKINDSTFKNCTSLEYIYLPDTINTFGNECFYGCSSLKRICIPNKSNVFSSTVKNNKDSVIPIELSYEEIENLNNLIHLTKGTTSFGDDLFYGCNNLMRFDSYYKNFVSEDGRCYIDGDTLMFFAPKGDLDEEENYIIPKEVNIRKINKSAFKGCEKLGKISLPPSLKIIGESAFEDCKKMYIDTNLSNVEEIGNKSFMNCENFCVIDTDSDSDNTTDITFDLLKIKSIGNYAFCGCKNLSTALNLPNTLSSIGAHCFEESGITELKLNMSDAYKINIISHHAFWGCTNLTNVILPDSIEYIQYSAFENCENIKEICLPLKLSRIGDNSFATNGSINIYINENTKNPPKFVYTSGLEDRSVSVMPFGENPNLNDLNIFAPTSELCETYKNDKHWKKYAKYIKKYDDNIK